MSEDSRSQAQATVTMPQWLRDALQLHGERTGETTSSIVRRALVSLANSASEHNWKEAFSYCQPELKERSSEIIDTHFDEE